MAQSSSNSGLIAVAYLPHGPMLLDPDQDDIPDGAKSIHSVCMKIGKTIANLKPDLIILSTPHGLSLRQAVNIYQAGSLNNKASGSFEWNNRYKEYSVEIELDQDASRDLYFHLQKEKHRLPQVEAMVAFDGLNTPLMWAEVVPLYFVLHQLASTQTDSKCLKHVSVKTSPKAVIIAQPELGLTIDDEQSFRQKLPTLLIEMGRAIRSWCNSSAHRIILIISGDQAHTHPWSPELSTAYQPHPSCHAFFPPCGTEHAEPFDKAINDWITGKQSNSEEKLFSLDQKLLIDEAGKHEEIAYSCGYSGSLVMQGVMENESIQSLVSNPTKPIDKSANWLLTDFIFHRPSYYGMMAALYLKNDNANAI